MIIERAVDAFSTSGNAKSVNTTWTYGDWQDGNEQHDTTLCFSFALTANPDPTVLEARVELSPDGGTTNRGAAQVVNFVSGGVIDVDDAVWDLPIDTSNNHMFEVTVRAGYAWRVAFKRTSGTGVSILATAEVCTV